MVRNQSGIAQIFIIVLLVLGLVASFYVINFTTTNLFPRANEDSYYSLSAPVRSSLCDQYVTGNYCNQPTFNTCVPSCGEGGVVVYNCSASQNPKDCRGRIQCDAEVARCSTGVYVLPTAQPTPSVNEDNGGVE